MSNLEGSGTRTGVLETNRGKIHFELYGTEAPKTVANFVELVERRFYDGLSFHRVVENFMCQTGCPAGDGTAGPGHTIPDEDNGLPHLTGSLSMANTGAPNTGGSQFFVCHRALPELQGKHTVFGRLTKGVDVLYKISVGDTLLGVRLD